MHKRILFLSMIYVLICGMVMPVFSGTTGKISGTVTDAATGEPLIGINVIIEGTSLGAATDLDGNYVINNIPPGTYNVIASGIGFGRRTFQGVKVNVDFTTELDFEMSTEAVEMETIVVQAESKLVRKDLTSSHTSIESDQIESLPVESISGLLSLQAGVTTGSGGELHIRGGRSTEVAYYVNGISVQNPFNNSQAVNIATNAVQELSVVSGTFNAEYGNALSGIVNTVTKEGGSEYHGNLSFYTGDYISSHDDIFYNIDDIDPLNQYVVEGTFGGPMPILNKNVSFFMSGRYSDYGGYLYGIRQHTPEDYVIRNPYNPNYLRVLNSGDSSDVAMNTSVSWSTTGKLTVKPFTGVKVNYDVLLSGGESQGYSHDWKYNPDGRPTSYSWSMLNSFSISHALSNSTFYQVKLSHNIDDYKSYLYPLIDEDGNPQDDFSADDDITGLQADPRYQPDYKLNKAASYTFLSGGTSNGHYYQKSTTINAKFDITSQINAHHEVKTGFHVKTHTMDYRSFTVKRDTVEYLEPTILGTESAYHDRYTKEPLEISAYIQDKIEYESIIMNLGFRYDYFDANSQYSTNTFYPSPNMPNLPTSIDKGSLLADAEAKHQFSPRIGISFPITDQGIIHFSYGHFFQIPPFRNLYVNPNFEYSFAIGTPSFGNANLNPEKTVSYELGLQQQLTDNLAFNVTGYYKDVRDLLATKQIRISGDQTYFKYVNQDYGNIKGIIFSLTKRKNRGDLFGATLDYTFQIAEGNDTDSDAFFLDLSSGRQSELVPIYLNWDQTHNLNAMVNFGEYRSWNVTLVGKLGTGLPYTPLIFEDEIPLKPNSDRKPLKATVDLLAEKVFDMNMFRITVFLKVFNLFDTLNENFVYSDTGRSTYTMQDERGGAEATDKLAEEVPGVISAQEYFKRPQYYDSPRQIRVGVSVEF